MSVLVGKNTKVLFQGITGSAGWGGRAVPGAAILATAALHLPPQQLLTERQANDALKAFLDAEADMNIRLFLLADSRFPPELVPGRGFVIMAHKEPGLVRKRKDLAD